MARNQRQNSLAPAAADSMMIRTAYATILDRNIDVVVTSGFRCKIDDFKICVVFVVVNSVALPMHDLRSVRNILETMTYLPTDWILGYTGHGGIRITNKRAIVWRERKKRGPIIAPCHTIDR